MSIIGKLHEICFYGLITTIYCLVSHKIDFSALYGNMTTLTPFSGLFLCFLFWSTVLFLPVAIIGAIETKLLDKGEGLTFQSDKVVVILFAHIGEEVLGLLMTPFWFVKDLISHHLTFVKLIDHITYVIEIVFIIYGLTTI